MDWQNHKNGCQIQQQLNIMNDAHKAQQEAKKPAGKPPRENCTGCGVKFTKVYPRDGDCQECGYQACESCVVHTSRGPSQDNSHPIRWLIAFTHFRLQGRATARTITSGRRTVLWNRDGTTRTAVRARDTRETGILRTAISQKYMRRRKGRAITAARLPRCSRRSTAIRRCSGRTE